MMRKRIWSMQNNTLGQRILEAIDTFLLNNALILIGLACIVYGLCAFYYSFRRVNRNTDKIDLAKRYATLKMWRRYRP